MTNGRVKNVVVVDDDPSFILIIKKALQQFDNSIILHSAIDIEAGFNLILDVSADLFILDIQLPKSSGIHLSNAIDELGKKNVPIIFVSGDTKYKKIIDDLDLHKDVWFVKKPIITHEFSQIIEACFTQEFTLPTLKKLGLYKRPRPIVVIAVFHLLEPIIKILYLKLSTGFHFKIVVNTIFSIETTKQFFDFWLVFPLAGLSLLSFKKGAYFFFLFIQSYIIYLHFSYESFTWPYVDKSPLLFSSALVSINICLIIYLALPKVRRPFFDKSIKWWATPKRYEIQIPCTLEFGDFEILGKTLNISRTGIFFRTDSILDRNKSVKVRFDHLHFKSLFRATIIHQGVFKGEKGVGIRFNLWQFGDYYQVVKFMSALKKLNI